MTYKSPPAPHPTGMRREDFEELREQQGMTPAGFREDSSDPLRGDKEAMERELLMRADDHLPAGLGGTANVVDENDGLS